MELNMLSIIRGMLHRLNTDLSNETRGVLTVKINKDETRGTTICLRIVNLDISRLTHYMNTVINGFADNNLLKVLGNMSQTRSYTVDPVTFEREYPVNLRTVYITLLLSDKLYAHLVKLLSDKGEFHNSEKVIALLDEEIRSINAFECC